VKESTDPRVAFLRAATWHGPLKEAEPILAAHPELASGDIHTAAVLGDDVAVRRFLERDAATATARSGPYGADGADPLNYLCLSKYLRLDPARSAAFLRAATALLDAGANPNTGFWTTGEFPEFETALYGAAGVAHHPEMTRLLLERGADPNDIEAVYHSPETRDNRAMELLVETGRVTAENLVLMLIRKHDWHDYDGVKYLLEHGANPNDEWKRGRLPIHHAIARDNNLEIIDLLLDHGADPARRMDGISAVERAARRGRGDLLELFTRRGTTLEFHGVDRLIAACAAHDAEGVRSVAEREPELVRELVAQGGSLLSEFAGTWNTNGLRHLLDLGVDVGALYAGDGYFDTAKDSTALHVAAWKGLPATVRLLIERGAPVNALDGKGRTALQLAVKACVDSYWTDRRTPETVKALLGAGASVNGVMYPSGYDAVDLLLRQHGHS
jgi:ankyrin repeat protein